jgi:hypothetical protein
VALRATRDQGRRHRLIGSSLRTTTGRPIVGMRARPDDDVVPIGRS